VESICFALYDLYFIVNPFEFAGMNGVIAVVEDSVTITIQHLGKAAQGPIIYRICQITPVFDGFAGPAA
jgi:hypothetical protein